MSRAFDTRLLAQSILGWWQSLYPNQVTGQRGDAGARAAMRRVGSPAEALLAPACHDLLRALWQQGAQPDRMSNSQLKRIALAATVICECRHDQTGPKALFEVLGAAPDGGRAPLSPLRFQALMATMSRGEGVEQLTALRRAVAHAKDAPFDVQRLVRDILTFSDDTRIRWTFDYYGTRRETSAASSVTEESLS